MGGEQSDVDPVGSMSIVGDLSDVGLIMQDFDMLSYGQQGLLLVEGGEIEVGGRSRTCDW